MGRGSMVRLRRFAAKLLAGQPVTVGARGGRLTSVATNHLFCATQGCVMRSWSAAVITATAKVVHSRSLSCKASPVVCATRCQRQRATHLTSLRHSKPSLPHRMTSNVKITFRLAHNTRDCSVDAAH
jgi:hypothetical protein